MRPHLRSNYFVSRGLARHSGQMRSSSWLCIFLRCQPSWQGLLSASLLFLLHQVSRRARPYLWFAQRTRELCVGPAVGAEHELPGRNAEGDLSGRRWRPWFSKCFAGPGTADCLTEVPPQCGRASTSVGSRVPRRARRDGTDAQSNRLVTAHERATAAT